MSGASEVANVSPVSRTKSTAQTNYNFPFWFFNPDHGVQGSLFQLLRPMRLVRQQDILGLRLESQQKIGLNPG